MRFKEPPSCLDSAYERKAMEHGLVKDPVFKENRMCDCYGYEETKAAQPAPKQNNHKPTWHLVIEDMLARDGVGRKRYNTPLQPFNGRDSLQDAYEEALDLCVYLKNAIEERKV